MEAHGSELNYNWLQEFRPRSSVLYQTEIKVEALQNANRRSIINLINSPPSEFVISVTSFFGNNASRKKKPSKMYTCQPVEFYDLIMIMNPTEWQTKKRRQQIYSARLFQRAPHVLSRLIGSSLIKP